MSRIRFPSPATVPYRRDVLVADAPSFSGSNLSRLSTNPNTIRYASFHGPFDEATLD